MSSNMDIQSRIIPPSMRRIASEPNFKIGSASSHSSNKRMSFISHSQTQIQDQVQANQKMAQISEKSFLNQRITCEDQLPLQSAEVSQESRPIFSGERGFLKAFHEPGTGRVRDDLRECLAFVRNPDEEKSKEKGINSDDLMKMTGFCRVERDRLTRGCSKIDMEKSRRVYRDLWKTRMLCFRIFHYLAEHNWELPSHVICVLIEECSLLHPKTLPYVVLALGHSMYRYPSIFSVSQTNLDLEGIIDNAIEKLVELDFKKNIEAIAVVIAGKTKLGSLLSPRQMMFVEQCLIDFSEQQEEDQHHPLSLEPNHLQGNLIDRLYDRLQLPVQRSSSVENHFLDHFRSNHKFVKKKKRMMKREEFISDQSLNKVSGIYGKITNEQIKNKILQLFVYAIANGRWNFTDSQRLISLLEETLTFSEYKFRSQALMIANTLLANGQHLQELKEMVFRGSYRQYYYALAAVRFHIQGSKGSSFTFDSKWSALFARIKRDAIVFDKTDLKDFVSVVQIRLDKGGQLVDPEDFTPLFAHQKYSNELMSYYLAKAREGEKIPQDVITVIIRIIKGELGDFGVERKCNAMAILRYVIENHPKTEIPHVQEVFQSTLDSIIDQDRSETSTHQNKAALLLIGHSLRSLFPTEFRKELVRKVEHCLDNSELISASLFVLSEWLLVEDENVSELFQPLFPKIMDVLRSVEAPSKTKKGATIVLRKAMQRQFKILNVSEIIALAGKTEALSYRYALIETALMSFKVCMTSSPWDEIFFDNLYVWTLQQPKSDQGMAELFFKYISILPKEHLISEQANLFALFLMDETQFVAIRAFEQLIEKGCHIEEYYCKKFAEWMSKGSQDFSINCTGLLELISKQQNLSEEVMGMVVDGLTFPEMSIVKGCLSVLRHPRHGLSRENLENCRNASLQPLVNIACGKSYGLENRQEAISLLVLCAQKGAFSLHELKAMIFLLNDESEEIQVKVIHFFVLLLPKLRLKRNFDRSYFTELIQAVEQCLKRDHLQTEATDILCTLGIQGYTLSHELVDEIARTLYRPSNQDLVGKIFELLQVCFHEGVYKDILDMLIIERLLKNPQTASDIKSKCIRDLIPLIGRKVELIPSIYQFLNFLLNSDSSADLYSQILSVCEAMVIYMNAISPTLFQALCHLPKQRLDPKCESKRAKILARELSKNYLVTRLAFPVIEEGFLEFYSSEMSYLTALEIMARRGFRLKNETIEKLLYLLGSENDEMNSKQIIKIFMNMNIVNFEKVHLENQVHHLQNIISTTSSSVLKEKLNRLINHLSSISNSGGAHNIGQSSSQQSEELKKSRFNSKEALNLSILQIEAFLDDLLIRLKQGEVIPKGGVKALKHLWLQHSSSIIRERALALLYEIPVQSLRGMSLEKLLMIEKETNPDDRVKQTYQFVQISPHVSVTNASDLLILFDSEQENLHDDRLKEVVEIFDLTKANLVAEVRDRILQIYAKRFFSYPGYQKIFISFFQHILDQGQLSDAVTEKIATTFFEQPIRRMDELEWLHILIRHHCLDGNQDVLAKIANNIPTWVDPSFKIKGIYILFDYLIGLSSWSDELVKSIRQTFADDSNSLSYHLLSFVERDPRSADVPFLAGTNDPSSSIEINKTESHQNDTEVEGNLQQKLLAELKWIDESEIVETQKLRLSEWMESNISHTQSRAIYFSLFRCKEGRLNIDQIIDIIFMINFLQPLDLLLLRRDYQDIEYQFHKQLLQRFTKDEKELKELISEVRALNWLPKDMQLFFSLLSSETKYSQIFRLISVIHHFRITRTEIEEILDGATVDNVSTMTLTIEKNRLFKSLAQKEEIDEETKIYINLAVASGLSLLNQGWGLPKLTNFFLQVSLKETIQDIALLLGFTADYQDNILESTFYRYVDRYSIGQCLQKLHEEIVEGHLKSSRRGKTLDKFLDDFFSPLKNLRKNPQECEYSLSMFTEKNESDQDPFSGLRGRINVLFDEMDQLYHQDREENGMKAIMYWTEIEIKQWADKQKVFEKIFDESSSDSLVQPSIVFAILKKATMIAFDYEPRITQLFAVYMILFENSDPILAQILTGEGKTHIIAMTAVIRALGGSDVDVITSSSELVKRDVSLYRPFFQLFGLSVEHNLDQKHINGPKPCYKANVVYGDPGNFQFDLLSHMKGFNTRGKRLYETAIIDEVDNILIEGNQTTALLSTPTPGMQELTPLLILVWNQLKQLKDDWDEFCSSLSTEAQLLDTRLMTKPDQEWAETELSEYIINIVDMKKMPIPAHLQDFVKSQAKDWARSAYVASFVLKFESHYDIKPNHEGVNSIAIIDFANTGVIQIGTTWEKGLHQFLQIKHGLSVDPISLVTHYSSVLSYVSQYSHKVGLTGTLGSSEVRQLFYDMFGFRSIEIPTFYEKRQLELMPNILENENLWLEEIARNACREADVMNRAVLIICETKRFALDLIHYLKHSFQKDAKSYVDDKSENNDFLAQEHGKGTVIVATNLAGRGTDLKVSEEVKRQGGLHVCVTFLPVNSRVQQQAFGRTSRGGAPGTVQLILNRENLNEQLISATEQEFIDLLINPKLIETLRKNQEIYELNQFRQTRLFEIEWEDELFRQFLKFLDEIKGFDPGLPGPKGVVVKTIYREELRKMKMEALQEEWGLWIKQKGKDHRSIIEFKNDLKRKTSKCSRSIPIFAEFRSVMRKAYKSDNIIRNPIYYLLLGHHLLAQSQSIKHVFNKNTMLKRAGKAYAKAIELDPVFSHQAYYHQALTLIFLQEGDYKQEAKTLLEQALHVIATGSKYLLNSAILSLNERKEWFGLRTSQRLRDDLIAQLNVYVNLSRSCEQAINQIVESLKLIVVESPIPCFSHLPVQSMTTEEANDYFKKIYRPVDGEVEPISLTLNHLKTRFDLGGISQLEKTLQEIFPTVKSVTLSFHSELLYSSRGKKHSLRALLPINRRHMRKFDDEENTHVTSSSQPSSSLPAHEPTEEVKRESVNGEIFQMETGEVLNGDKMSSSVGTGEPQLQEIRIFDDHLVTARNYVNKKREAISKQINRGVKVVSKGLKRGKEYVQEGINNYKSVESVRVNLTLRNLSPEDVQKVLQGYDRFSLKRHSSPAPHEPTSSSLVSEDTEHTVEAHHLCSGDDNQEFGFGPIKLSEQLLNYLKSHWSDLIVSLVSPQQSNHEEDDSNASDGIKLEKKRSELAPKERVVSNLSQNDVNAEISFLRCKASFLKAVMEYVDSNERSLTLVMHQLEQQKADYYLRDNHYYTTLSFAGLTKKEALLIAKLTFGEHNYATLTIPSISLETAKTALQLAHRTERSLIVKCHSIDEELLTICSDPSFIQEYRLNGFNLFFEIDEQLPIPWRSLMLLTTLSAAEIAGGVCLAIFTFGFGTSVGKGLTVEGVFDLIRAFRVFSERKFRLSSFVSEKAISLALLFMTAGISSSYGRVIHKGQKTALGLTRGVSNYPTDSSQVVSGQQAIELLQKVATNTSKRFTNIMVDKSIQIATHSVVERLEPRLKMETRRAITNIFSKDIWYDRLNFIFALDHFEMKHQRIEGNERLKKIKAEISTYIAILERDGHTHSAFRREAIARCEVELSSMIRRMRVGAEEELKKIVAHLAHLDEKEVDSNWNVLLQYLYDRDKKMSLEDKEKIGGAIEVIIDFRDSLHRDFSKNRKELKKVIIELFFQQSKHRMQIDAKAFSGLIAKFINFGKNEGIDALSNYLSGATAQGNKRDDPDDGRDNDDKEVDCMKAVIEGGDRDDTTVVNDVEGKILSKAKISQPSASRIASTAHRHANSKLNHHSSHHHSSSSINPDQTISHLCYTGISSIFEVKINNVIAEICRDISIQGNIIEGLLKRMALTYGDEVRSHFDMLEREQIKIIKGFIRLLLISNESTSGEKYEEKRIKNQVDQQFSTLYRNSEGVFLGLEQGESIATQDSSPHTHVNGLRRAWIEYQKIKEISCRIVTPLDSVGNSSFEEDFISSRCFDFGTVMQFDHSKPEICAVGMILNQVGGMIKGYIETKKYSVLVQTKLKCIAIHLMNQSLRQYSEIQKSMIQVQTHSSELTLQSVNHLTEIAHLITESYKDFIDSLLSSVLEEDSQQKTQKIQIDFSEQLNRQNAWVEQIKQTALEHTIDKTTFDLCLQLASESFGGLVKAASEIVDADSSQLQQRVNEFQRNRHAEIDIKETASINEQIGLPVKTATSSQAKSLIQLDSRARSLPIKKESTKEYLLYEGIRYRQVLFTLGDGACAIHALVGSAVGGQYIWSPKENTSSTSHQEISFQVAAKNYFLSTVKPLIGSGDVKEKLLLEAMEEELIKTEKFKTYMTDIEVSIAYCKNTISELMVECYHEHSYKFDQIFRKSKTEFQALQSSKHSSHQIRRPLMNCYQAEKEKLMKIDLRDLRWQNILEMENTLISLEEKRTGAKLNFVRENFELYEILVRPSDYYLCFNELEVFANLVLPDIKVIVFHQDSGQLRVRIINPHANQGVIAIKHDINHFSRLEEARS